VEAWLARAARVRGDRAALITAGGTVDYAWLYAQARAIAGELVARGIGAGDRVALALPSAELVTALHGCLLIGAVAVPIDLRLRQAERDQRAAGAALVLNRLQGSRASAGGPAQLPESRPVDPGATATLMFTSGTTAGPKPVTLTYDNWFWNAIGSAIALGLDPAETWLCPMPLAHVGGLSIALRSVIYGTTVLLHDRFDTDRALAALMDPGQRVTLVSLVPTMLARLLDAGLREPPALRRVLLGGGPIAPALLRRAELAGITVAPSYGMTETCSQVVTDGVALLGIELRIAADGEILVRGRNVSAGALDDDGWLHTADLGRLDDAGRLVISGRRSDTIVSGGENVAPAEVEAALIEYPGIADVAVFGRADAQWGEAVVAHVVMADGHTMDPEQLRAHCAQRLAPFKVPKRFEPVTAVPRGVTGKLRRRELS
jgi:O-succinylbenzoic acid--CoA ligase